MNTTKKITRATVKSFISKNRENLLINVHGSFDGMTDCVESENDGWQKAVQTDRNQEYTMGISGAWFVGSSRDYFQPIEESDKIGVYVYNSCGSFSLAIQK